MYFILFSRVFHKRRLACFIYWDFFGAFLLWIPQHLSTNQPRLSQTVNRNDITNTVFLTPRRKTVLFVPGFPRSEKERIESTTRVSPRPGNPNFSTCFSLPAVPPARNQSRRLAWHQTGCVVTAAIQRTGDRQTIEINSIYFVSFYLRSFNDFTFLFSSTSRTLSHICRWSQSGNRNADTERCLRSFWGYIVSSSLFFRHLNDILVPTQYAKKNKTTENAYLDPVSGALGTEGLQIEKWEKLFED